MIFLGKGSNQRKIVVTRKERNDNYTRIFGSKMTWLDHKRIAEAWAMN